MLRLWNGNRQLAIGILLFLLLILITLLGRGLLPENELQKVDFGQRLLTPGADYWFGTDDKGRDMFTLVVYGIGIDLLAVVAVLFFSFALGVIIGGLAGFLGGAADDVLMRLTDVFFSLPPFVLAMAVAAALGKGMFFITLALIIASWPPFARLVRGQILKEKEKTYVEALYALGIPRHRIFLFHILPNIVYPVIVYGVTIAGVTILYISGLSYIGFGPGPYTPELGQLISEGQKNAFSAPWQIVFPGLTLFLIVLAFNFVGEGLKSMSGGDQDANRPK